MNQRVDRAPKAAGPPPQAPPVGDMPRWLPLAAFTAALLAALWRAPAPDAVIFAAPAAKQPAMQAPILFSEKIPETNGNIGPSSQARLPDGRLLLAWQETRTEDAGDSTIRLLTQDKQGNWGKAKDVANRPLVAGSSFAYASQLGAPLLHAEGTWLHLWFVSHAISDWRSAALQYRFSSDGGNTWSVPRKTTIAAGFNPGQLRLQPAQALGDGGLALPLREGGSEQTTAWLRLASTGQPIDKLRLPAGQNLLPQGPAALNLPDGAQAVLDLSNNKLLAAGNPQGDRKHLQLWLSDDHGQHWKTSRIIEQSDDGAAEFTAPFLLLATDGQIHLTYTWRRQSIKHLRFNTAWLEAEQP